MANLETTYKKIPTAGWTVNTELLTGDKTLVEGDETIQLLDCNGSIRTVTLPTNPTPGTFFIIKNNNNTYTDGQWLNVNNSGGNLLDRLYTSSSNGYYWDGTYWQGLHYPIDFTGTPLDEYNLRLGQNTIAHTGGTAIGAEASAYNRGVGIGPECRAWDNGVAIGYQSRGAGSISIGYRAGDNISSATDNILIGYDIDAQSTTVGGELSIGNLIFGLGGFGTAQAAGAGRIMIGTPTDDAVNRLQVDGGSAEYLTLTAGETVAAGDLCYFKSDGKMWKADADAESTTQGLLGIASAAISADASDRFLTRGIWTTTGLTQASEYYVSLTAAGWTTTKPSTSNQVVRSIGYALSTTQLYFNPDNGYVVMV